MANPNCGACGHMNTRGFCNLTACIFPCPTGMGGYINKPQTNADRIRNMTDEELAELFANDNCGYCRIHDFCFAKGCAINCEDVWLDWLKQVADIQAAEEET